MSAKLVPCEACGRHVRQSEAACPFCRVTRAAGAMTPAASGELAPRSRAALMGFAASPGVVAISTALMTVGCSVSSTGTDAGGSASDAGATADAGLEEDAGAVGPLYGGPPEDAGAPEDAGTPAFDGATPEIDAGGPAPLYGGPPPPSDAGAAEDAGAPGLLYGGPPGA